jgi:hypothetical protein
MSLSSIIRRAFRLPRRRRVIDSETGNITNLTSGEIFWDYVTEKLYLSRKELDEVPTVLDINNLGGGAVAWEDVTDKPEVFPSDYPPDLQDLGEVSTDLTIDLAGSKYGYYLLDATDDITINAPTSPGSGAKVVLRIMQGAGAPHAITLGAGIIIPESASNPLPWSTSQYLMDTLVLSHIPRYSEGGFWVVDAFTPGLNLD